MSALDEILESKPKTFEEASALDEILTRPKETSLTTPGLAPGFAPAAEQFTRKLVRPGEGIGFKESFKQEFIEDFGMKSRRLAEQLFPGDPDAHKRFGMVDGNIVFVNNEGVLQKAKGGARDLAGTITGFTPEVAGSVAGAFTGSPLLGSAVGATTGRAFKEIIGIGVFDDPKTSVDVIQNLGLEFISDFAAGMLGKGITKLKERRAVEGVTDAVFKSEAKRQAVKDATGIELDLAQVTNLPKINDLKRWARNFPGDASEIIKANDELVAGQVDEAIERVINTVAKPDDTAALGTTAINAAQAAITAAKAEVANVTSPLYKKAFLDGDVNVDPVIQIINEKLESAKGPRRTLLKQVRLLFNKIDSNELDASVRGLHDTKLSIDAELNKSFDTAIKGVMRADLTQIKEALLNQLSEASPSYDLARQEFSKAAEQIIDPLQNGVVGVLANVSNQKAATAAAKMFADGNVNDIAIKRAREAIQKQNPEAWDGIVRQWLMHQFNRASKEIQIGESINVAGKFRQAVIGTRQQKAAMKAALGPEARVLFDQTMEALQMVSRTPTASSATEFNRLVSEELGTSVGSVTRAVLQPRQTIISSIDQKFLQSQAVRIAEALTDPSKRKQLKMLQTLKPGPQRARIAISIIGFLPPREFIEDFLEFDVKPEVLNE